LSRPPLKGSQLVVDQTGCGRPVVDLIKAAKLEAKLVPVTITAGLSESHSSDGWHVAKVILISGVQVLLQERRLRFAASLPETPTLVKELQSYRVRVTPAANETFNAREGQHDDLLLAVCLAVWAGQRLAPASRPVLDQTPGAATGNPTLW